MKTKLPLVAVFLSTVLAISSVGARAQTPVAPAKPTVPATPDATSVSTPEYNSWDDIKTLSYEHKAEFTIGLSRLQTKLDKQIAELKDKRAKMKGPNSDWDFAMRNLDDARSYLKSVGTEADAATAENWNDQKEKLAKAWQSAQDMMDRVKSTTTQ